MQVLYEPNAISRQAAILDSTRVQKLNPLDAQGTINQSHQVLVSVVIRLKAISFKAQAKTAQRRSVETLAQGFRIDKWLLGL